MSLKFHYGVINSGKTKDLLKIYNNYTMKHMNPVVINFDKTNKKRNRIYNTVTGESCPVISCSSINQEVVNKLGPIKAIDILLVDNGQLMDKISAETLRTVADIGIPVVVFGLRTKYTGELYEGAVEMFRLADKFEEVVDICWCNKKAVMSGAYGLEDFKTIRHVKDTDKVGYIGVCSEHWHDGKFFKGKLGKRYKNKEEFYNALVSQWSDQRIQYEFGDNYSSKFLNNMDTADYEKYVDDNIKEEEEEFFTEEGVKYLKDTED